MGFYQLTYLFFAYSFLGWLGEVLTNAVRKRRYQDCGVLNGPLCILYGIGGLIISFALGDLQQSWFFLLGLGAVYATVLEWIAGHILERVSHTRWWDYSDRKFNLDGYICLGASVLWGLLSVFMVKWGNPLLLFLFDLIPGGVRAAVLWAGIVVFAIDAVGTFLTMLGLRYRWPPAEAVENRLANLTLRAGLWILGRVERRMTKAHPAVTFEREKKARATVFAAGCSPYKIVLLFIIGAFLGDVVETIFCRITAGYWMSRSSLVWGPFSIVWGLAIALVTLLLYRYKDKSASWLFVTGTLLGGAYEYLCSVFTEVVFGAVFWDYSAIPFNLGGRINLLYCFFWGFAAVAWFKVFYPPLSRMIERIPRTFGKVLTWCLCLFMVADMAVSSMALVRYNQRLEGIPPRNEVAVYLDEHYDDARMQAVYPKAVHTG
ncbi:MAG TPA: putative ABC transporter permease [Candidatus Gemmiger avistercoris]|uniref:ABC transporter permease n=1 Tax=Candidatus Gemmiger avistercoris TaxID=2838606 RepID=A0A9D2FLI7_9FIRM|nr:putative ABC transporter permease [uncultured Subdoligranulum sp.]HIZ62865.1 putative ABC transporter permease [Candidatus Gemmiger avistercoris]